MSNIYRKLQQRALRPKGDNIVQPYKTACLALNETKSQSLLKHFEIKDSTRLQTASYTGNA